MFQRAALGASKMKKTALKKESRPMPAENSVNIRNWKIRAGDSSPNFAPVGSEIGFIPKFAFSMSAVLLLVLLVQIGWVYKNELKNMIGFGSGIVAGAEDSKMGLDVVRNSSIGYLGNQGDEVKENISLSRVLIKAAMEKENSQ